MCVEGRLLEMHLGEARRRLVRVAPFVHQRRHAIVRPLLGLVVTQATGAAPGFRPSRGGPCADVVGTARCRTAQVDT